MVPVASSARGFGLDLFCICTQTEVTFTILASPQLNGIAECRIGMVMDVARTSMIHAAAPHFLWPFVVQYAAHKINLQPRVSLPETTPTLRWTGKVGDASVFRVRGSRALVCDTSADKLFSRAVPCVFLGFPPYVTGWQFYHDTSRRVLTSQDVTFNKSVSYYRLSSRRSKPKSHKCSPQCVVPIARHLAETVDWPSKTPLSTFRKRLSEARWAAQPDLLVQAAPQESCAEVQRVQLVVTQSSDVQQHPKSSHLRGGGEGMEVVNSLSLTEAPSN
ncbi:unnamed protein product, partial [Closterium sp. NIES-54]